MARQIDAIEHRRRAALDAIAYADKADELARAIILRTLTRDVDLEQMLYIRQALAACKRLAQQVFHEVE